MLEHPTIYDLIMNKHTPKKKLEVGDQTLRGEVVKVSKKHIETKGHWGNGEEIKKWDDIDKIKLSPDWNSVHGDRDKFKEQCKQLKEIVSGINLGHGSYGIYNNQVDESNRDAYDVVQIIRHEFWKSNPERSSVTVDSSIWLNNPKKNNNVKVELDKQE
jgi:hypothetical protein